MTSTFASLTEQDIEKIVTDKDSQNIKRSSKVSKELFADYVKDKKLREPEEKKELAQMTLKTFYVEARKKELVQCIIIHLLDWVYVISRIIKVSVRFISLRLRRLRLITLIILDITKTSSNNCLITSGSRNYNYHTSIRQRTFQIRNTLADLNFKKLT